MHDSACFQLQQINPKTMKLRILQTQHLLVDSPRNSIFSSLSLIENQYSIFNVCERYQLRLKV